MRGGVGELVRPRHIACGIDVRVQRFQIVVGGDRALHGDAQLFQTETFEARTAPYRADQRVEFDAARLAVMFHHDVFMFALFLAAHRLVIGQHFHAVGNQCGTRQFRHFDILADHDARRHFDLRDVGAQPRKTLCQLAADRAAAQHHQPLRRFIQFGEG